MDKFDENKKFHNAKLFLQLNLSFFAEDKDSKTEDPTDQKKRKAREEGNVPKSQEVGTAFLFITSFVTLKIFGASIFKSSQEIFVLNFSLLSSIDDVFTESFLTHHIAMMFADVLLIIAPLLAVTMVVGVLSNMIQFGWNFATKPLIPKFNRLSPVSGFKRMVSMQQVVTMIKAIAKLAVIGIALYMMVSKEIHKLPDLATITIMESLIYLGGLITNMGINVGILFVFIALADVFYTRFTYTKNLKMTKQEVKEEYKQMEGNPQIKAKIRQKMQEASMRRMMQDVPNADVIITNPTHFAVAIRYDKDAGDAPKVVAKGADFLAKKIREKAKENDVQIVENRQLARALYATCEIGQEIPQELYQTVAEILAFVYKLKGSKL